MKQNSSSNTSEIKTDIFEHCYTVTLSNTELITLWSTDGIVDPCGTIVMSTNSQNSLLVYTNNNTFLTVTSLLPEHNKFSATFNPLTSIQVRHLGTEETYQIFLKVAVHYKCC